MNRIWTAVTAVLLGGACESHGSLQAAVWLPEVGCSGALVGPRAVLSAAHCVGEVRTVQFTSGAAGVVDSCQTHDDAGLGNGRDLMMCHLRTDAPVPPAQPAFHAVDAGQEVVAAGWASEPPGRLMRTWRSRVVRTQADYHLQAPPGAMCPGDSGGPAFQRIGRELRLVAIASARPRDGSCELAGTASYSPLYSNQAWIESQL